LRAEIATQKQFAEAVLYAPRKPCLPVGRAADHIREAANAFVRLVLVVADDVDHAADSVAAVQQRRRAFHDLNTLCRQRIDRLSMVARL
jgi:hypothetical protein